MTKDGRSGAPRTGMRAGLPYDFRLPSKKRLRQRAWNPEDHRLFTPKTFGWGYGVNLYWLVHPLKYLHGRQSR